MKNYLPVAATAAILAATSLTPALAQDPNSYYRAPSVVRDIPLIDTTRQYQDSADVNFVTGGIGDDERQAIEAAAGNYNVHVTNATVQGAFVEDTPVTIRTKAGEDVLSVDAGPLLYVQLPPGSYVLEAVHGDEMKKKNIVIGKKTKSQRVHLGWKIPARLADQE